MQSDDKKYSQVPPPVELTTTSAAPPVDFSNALQKARAIAEKLRQTGASLPSSTNDSTSATTQQHDHDDHDYSSSTTYDPYESKRGAYDNGSSRPSYSRNEPRRYGLGSEERQRYQSYGSSSSSTEEIKVPNRMVGMIIGRGGDNLKKIERNSGAHQIQLARDMIEQIIRDASGDSSSFAHGESPESSISVMVPPYRVGLVIGRGGETIRDLEQRSGAKVKVLPENPGEMDRTVSITGTKKATEKAKSLIDDILNNQPSQRGHESSSSGGYGRGVDEASDIVRIPKQMVGLIIGRGGETVRALQAESGARIVVDKYGDPHSDEKTLTLHGSPDKIAIAKDLIMEKVESGQVHDHTQYGGSYSGYDYEGTTLPDDNKDDTKLDKDTQQVDPYYGQYYDQTTGQGQWAQEAYNQWYQQQYGTEEGYQAEGYQAQYEQQYSNQDSTESTSDEKNQDQ
ncbi:uncharacterized protein BX664DRAFT_265084 [Halteromyces radiatus]|uniref:uncharacterized protein n=1 Tax=Halteromyces radiatus TaxID=101107 RepID=UPI00221F5B66|nr:uncharacterized protein BX664DRAFT_265084 [Halteromyces radiatus]KAI8085992.1 hypothetical protein BX664DRAFT_265084 [Halteromyces radiatus]